MKKSIANSLVLFVVIVSIFTFINMVSVDRAEAVSCPDGLICRAVNSVVACPVGYTCTPTPVCPVGYVCTPIEIQPTTCPPGYICKLTNNGGGSSGNSGGSGGSVSNRCYRFETNLTVGSFWTGKSKGADVVALQTLLIAKGFDIPSISSGGASKGFFGAETKSALMRYQASVGIPATGVADPQTRVALNSLCGSTNSPSITVLTPKNGGILEVGKAYDIRWTNYSGNEALNIYLQTTLPDNTTSSRLIASDVPATGSYRWVVPSENSNNKYKIEINPPGGREIVGRSDGYFSIVAPGSTPAPTPYSAPSAKIISPNGGETWTIGQTYLISTASNGELGTRTIKLNRYSDDSVRVGSEVIGTTNTDSFYFKVPVGTAETRYEANRYKIQVQSNRYNEGMGVADESDGYISIVSSAVNPSPSVTVTSPNSGETWSIGDKKTITWSYANWNSGIFGNKYVDMYLVPMDGRSPIKLATNFNSPDGTVSVTIHEKTSDGRSAWLPGRYKIRVVCNTANVAPFNSCMDESDGYITIFSNPPSPTPIPDSTSVNNGTILNASIWDAIKQYFDSKQQ